MAPNYGNDNTYTTAFPYTSTATNVRSFTYRIEEKPVPQMVEDPAFIQIDLVNNTRITGRFSSYSDPTRADAYGAFVGNGADGSTHYVLWAGIVRVTVFPLTADNPTAPAPEPIKDAPQS